VFDEAPIRFQQHTVLEKIKVCVLDICSFLPGCAFLADCAHCSLTHAQAGHPGVEG